MGDEGDEESEEKLLSTEILGSENWVKQNRGRPWWAVTVLQAEEEFDAGPVRTLSPPPFPILTSKLFTL
jgi:hypothetical protein